MKTIKQLNTVVRPLAFAMALAGLAAFGLSGCDDATGKTAEAPAPAGPPISAATVVEKSITETQEFSGRLEAIERVEIRSRVGGFITAVNFKPGSEVKKGDVLFVIDTRPFQAEANRAEAAAVSARAKADLAKLELVRAEKLLADKAIAQREYDEKASGLKELDANARAAQAQYESAKLNLGYSQVTSPINGRVSKAEITVGNLIDGAAVLTSVVSTDRIYASFEGDEETYLRVASQSHKGQPVVVKVGLANEAGFPHEGKLEFVDNQLDPKTGSVRMRATFANADNILVPGLFARVQVGAGAGDKAQTQAILINDRAVGTDQNRKFVFVVGADGKAEYRPVKLGATSDGLRMVREGLKSGEKIVVNGLQRVRPGSPVTAQMVAMDFDPAAPVAAADPLKPDTKVDAKADAKPAAKDAKVAAKAESTTKE
ncbi:efflux RND transporter periplasmic adaptor subunit [Oxalobacteraceae bacterium]|nr:efflux RND transporter periplasmic adaptor subunit [Oxalobacteraceae bacterium]